jgi:CheY-like chemotaxis protein
MSNVYFRSQRFKDDLRGSEDRELKRKKSSFVPHILIADDDHEAAQFLQIVLMNYGFETTLAFDGKDALKKIAKKPFDLIFLDIKMPGLNGTEVLAKIQEARSQHVTDQRVLPVITYSSSQPEEFRVPDEKGFRVVEHWQKPMTLPELTRLAGKTVMRLHILTPAVPH